MALSPRQISAEMLEAMKAAAAEVWERRKGEIAEGDRREWRKFCWAHVVAHFHKQKVQE